MTSTGSLKVTTPSEREIAMTRVCDAVLKSPMESGVAESYDELDGLLAETWA